MKPIHTAFLCALLSACASVSTPPAANPASATDGGATIAPMPTEDLVTRYTALRKAAGQVFKLDAAKSTVRIYAYRGGKAAKFGHNHVLSAPSFQGYFHLAPDGTTASRFDLEFRLDQLVFDEPEHRASLGPAFASTISVEDRASTRTNMLGDNNFQAAKFPLVRIESRQITGDGTKFAAKVAVEVHGQTREIWAPLTVIGLPDKLEVQGSFVLKQSDFGIKTFSLFGGLLAVQDETVVEFKLVGERP